MLETDIRAVYERMADASQPPSRISIPDAGRRGQARLRTRRASVIAAPVLAATAVLAIAVPGAFSGATARPPDTGHGQPGPARPPAGVPEPFVAFGRLPAGLSPSLISFSTGGEVLVASSPATTRLLNLTAWPRGYCAVTTRLVCGGAQLVVPSLSDPAPHVNGLRAYWTGPVQLAFQYAPDSWALSGFQTRASSLAVAQHLIIGSKLPPLRYPAQLAGTPYRHLLEAGFAYQNGSASLPEASWTLAARASVRQIRGLPYWPDSPQITMARAGSSLAAACRPLSGTRLKPGAAHGTPVPGTAQHEVINGYRVLISGLASIQGSLPIAEACAGNADGLYVMVSIHGRGAVAAVTRVFTDLKLYGINPANWTTRPAS